MSTQQQEMTAKEEFQVLESLLDKITDDQMRLEAQKMVMDRAQSFQWKRTALGANRENAQMCISAGRAFGLDAFTSLNSFDVIQGSVAMRASLRGALLQKNGWHWAFVEHTDKVCSLIAVKDGKPFSNIAGSPHVFTYTIDMAKRAKLDSKDNWKSNPEDMLFARCITRLQRRVCPAATLGMDIPDISEPFVSMDEIVAATPQMQMPRERIVVAEDQITEEVAQ